VEGVEVDISCQTENLGNVTPTLGLTRLGLAAQTKAGVETVLHIAIVLDVLTTEMVFSPRQTTLDTILTTLRRQKRSK